MTAARRPDEFAGPCRVNTLPPLYPHCMRHQQHRCLYSNPPPPPPPPPLCRPPHLPQACSDGHLETHLLQRRLSERRPPSAQKLPNDGLLVLKVVSSASAEPDKKTQYEIVSVNERHGRFRKAVPCMPLALSILLCIVNMLAPGVVFGSTVYPQDCFCERLKMIAENLFIVVISLLSRVSIAMRKPEIGPVHFSKDLRVGKRTVITCSVIDGDPPFEFTWLKDGQQLSDTEIHSIKMFDEFTSVLSISNLNAYSNGNYSCKVSNAGGIDEKHDFLLVKVSPQWVQEPKDLSAMGGQTAVLDCYTRGYPKPVTVWKKQNDDGSDQTIMENSRWKVSENGSLIFKKITKDDEGIYTCDVSNGVGEGLRKSARLNVKAPPRISSAYRIKSARKAESTTLVCEAEGDQPLITSWAKNGVGLQTTGRVQINEELSATGIVAQFTILSTHRNDGGSYTCSAKNQFGDVNNTIILRIVEPPERPLSVKVGEVWSRAATVSWSSPFDGNSPITQYIVHYWKDIEGASHRLQERNVPATQTSVLLNDLQPGTTYLLRVVAENDVGRGESSEPFKLRTEEEAPSAPPTDVTVIATGPTSVSVTWKAPPREHWNGRLLGYYVGHKRHQSSEPYAFHTVAAGRSTHADYRLTRLQKATRYSVVVKAFNSVGSGPESHELLVETSDKDSLKPPHLYVSETSDTAALLEWEHPRDLPENVFTHYMVYYRPGAEGSWHSVHVPSKDKRFKLTSLESGTKYQVYLTAYSESGVSDPSDTLTLLTEGKALAPSIVNVAGDTPYYLKLHFIVPVAASIVIIVIVIVVAWVWVKKAQFRDEREAARVSLYAEAYYTLPHKPGFYPPQPATAATMGAGPTVTQDDAYDVPWDLPVARPKQ